MECEQLHVAHMYFEWRKMSIKKYRIKKNKEAKKEKEEEMKKERRKTRDEKTAYPTPEKKLRKATTP